ncbi:MAG: NHLP family bacteriocin export ABC transporter peptidase/permease/ATPase subunit [Desulfobacterales bacterium]|nr:NHLP family bacteriocin export ABC transporter peptidase/permease/ATPase subunit [Desulfobacterales bacterium]
MAELTDKEIKKQFKKANKKVKTPTVLQMEAVECGAAALGIVLGYHGRIVPLEQLRLECGVSRDGSKANNVLRAARKYGMIAKGFKMELDQLFLMDYPAILFWNMNHFVVLEGFKRGKVYLNDPAVGRRITDFEELDASFSGVVLAFEKSPEFKEGGIHPSLFRALRRRLEGSEYALLFVILCGLMLVAPGFIIPTFARVFIDECLISQKASLIKPIVVGMFLTAIMRMILTWLQGYFLLKLETKIALKTSSGFFEHILRLPVSYFTQRYAGEIGSRVLINNKVAEVVTGKMATTLLDCALIVFYGVLLILYDAVLTFICIFLALFNILALKLVARRRIDASRRLLQESGKLIGTAMGGLGMIETLKATGSEGEFFARWAGHQAKALKSEQELTVINKLVSMVPSSVNSLITATILTIGGMRVMDGYLTVGMLIAFQSLMANFTKPIETFVGFGGALQELEGDMNRLDDVLNYSQDEQYTKEVDTAEYLKNLSKLSGHIELKNIVFGYSPLDAPLIENFNLTVKPGERIALVGRSGSGKTTVARLIAGLYKPWGGEILFDGVPRKLIPHYLFYNSVGIVDQDIILFGCTIRENLTMWDYTIPDINITTAARDAAIDEVIQTRHASYDAVLEEGGGNLSGGQRQRMEIARALVGHPSILILDEATSALDSTTEKIIGDHLRRRGCASIIVAHRLSTIRDCDEIIVMDHGKIVERGRHEELVSQDGLYKALIQE